MHGYTKNHVITILKIELASLVSIIQEVVREKIIAPLGKINSKMNVLKMGWILIGFSCQSKSKHNVNIGWKKIMIGWMKNEQVQETNQRHHAERVHGKDDVGRRSITDMSITHETRRQSHEQIKPKKSDRKALIMEVLEQGSKTAHEITQVLLYRNIIPYYDRNFVSPRLTELKEMGEVEVIGKKYEGRTDRKVAVWKLKEAE